MIRILFILGGTYLLNEYLTQAEIGKLNKYRFIPVYKELPTKSKNGKSNIAWSRGKKGVYIIKEDNKIVYVGYSVSNLYKTIIRHFQEWNDSSQEGRVSYRSRLNKHRYTVRIIIADQSRASKLEKGLIEKYQPRDNYQFTEIEFPQKVEQVVEEYKEAPTDYPPDWDF